MLVFKWYKFLAVILTLIFYLGIKSANNDIINFEKQLPMKEPSETNGYEYEHVNLNVIPDTKIIFLEETPI